MRLEDINCRAGYSRAAVHTVIEVTKCSEAQAYEIIDYMDKTGYHPDWSEFTTSQFRRHFIDVLEEMLENH